mgnify:CR=1 FL=1
MDKKIKISLLGCFLVAVVPFLYLGFCSFPSADDFGYAVTVIEKGKFVAGVVFNRVGGGRGGEDTHPTRSAATRRIRRPTRGAPPPPRGLHAAARPTRRQLQKPVAPTATGGRAGVASRHASPPQTLRRRHKKKADIVCNGGHSAEDGRVARGTQRRHAATRTVACPPQRF